MTALVDFHLAPLAVRRDIAMLGLIHRTVLGKGPAQFAEHFQGQSHHVVRDPRKDFKNPLIKRSALGLVAIYNMLPQSTRAARTVKLFQRSVQAIISNASENGHPKWHELLSPRVPLTGHPLGSLF